MIGQIVRELKEHSSFTVFGAITGIVIMAIFHNIPYRLSYTIFYTLHPVHVVLSALVTASMYDIHKRKESRGGYQIWKLLIVGYIGAVGIATLSDSVIPYFGEVLLDMPKRSIHIGFVEKWWLVNPLAILGVAIAYFRPATKFPHAGHVLLSTWASLFHIMMAGAWTLGWLSYITILFFLFIAVWIPCCMSDIVFPLLFVKESEKETDVQ